MIVIKDQDKDNALEVRAEQEDKSDLDKRLDSIKKQHPKLILNLQRDFLIEREQAESRFWHEVEEIKERAKQKEETILRILIESEDKRGGIITVAEQPNSLTPNTNNTSNNTTTKKYITNPEANNPNNNSNNTPDNNKHKYY